MNVSLTASPPPTPSESVITINTDLMPSQSMTLTASESVITSSTDLMPSQSMTLIASESVITSSTDLMPSQSMTLIASESVITSSTDLMSSQSMALIATVTTNPIPTLTTVPTSGTDNVEIVGKVVGPLGGLILLVFIIVIAIMSYYFKHHYSSQCNLNTPIKLKKYQNARGKAAVEINNDNCNNDNTFYDTLTPLEGIVYDNAVSPPVFTSGGNKELMEEETYSDLYIHVYATPRVVSKSHQQPVKITNDNIKEIRELGNGHFGKVMLAATQGLSLKDMKLSKTDDNREASILVAVKKLIDHPSKTQRESFIKEAKFTSSLNHKNVVKIIGVCYDESAFMMMEYMEEGDLNEFLQQYTEIVETPSNNTQISTSTVVYMASQIASAMKYLASLNFIHRDIASRNCLVGKNLSVKLADFGMSRNLYESHYYQMQGKTALPIRWMATECFYGLFSEKSDVWAFGVTMWELFILAKGAPYSDFSDEEMIIDATQLKGAHRQLLPRPSVCPIPVYNIMRRCWAIDPKERANFEEVEEMLQSYMAS